MPPEPVIHVRDLVVRYGALTAVNRASFTVAAGTVFGLVGPNGAGKTSTLKVLAGLLRPDAGAAAVCVCDAVTARDALRARIGYMADFFGVYDYLTVEEYLAFFGGMYGLSGERLATRIAATLDCVTLAGKRPALVKTLSRGMKQRLYFARALIHDPPVLILDEPASGMDPRGRAELVATLKDLGRAGKTIVISSHILDELQDLCDHVGIMETGRLVAARPLRRAVGAPAGRAILLAVAAATRERALAWLGARPGVTILDARGATLRLGIADDDAAATALLRDMLDAGLAPLPPRADDAAAGAGNEDLRAIFLGLTRGELM